MLKILFVNAIVC